MQHVLAYNITDRGSLHWSRFISYKAFEVGLCVASFRSNKSYWVGRKVPSPFISACFSPGNSSPLGFWRFLCQCLTSSCSGASWAVYLAGNCPGWKGAVLSPPAKRIQGGKGLRQHSSPWKVREHDPHQNGPLGNYVTFILRKETGLSPPCLTCDLKPELRCTYGCKR